MKIAIFTVLALSGCATQQLDRGLQGLLGHNIQEVVAIWGYPDAQREVMGDTVYIWSTNQNVSMPLMTSSTTTGHIGGTPVYGTTSQLQFVPMAFACTVQLAVNPDRMIKNYQWEGNQGGCRRYSSRFP